MNNAYLHNLSSHLPLFSIIIPAYNAEKTIAAALNSAMRQTLDNIFYEIIVIDDGSTDATWKIMEEHSRACENMRIFKNEQNIGQGATLNRAIHAAKGLYMTFLDAGDLLSFDALEQFAQALQDMPDIVYGQSRRCYDSGIEINVVNSKFADKPCATPANKTFASSCRGIYKRAFIVNNSIFFTETHTLNDTVFIFKANKNANTIKRIEHILYYNILRNDSITESVETTLLIEQHWKKTGRGAVIFVALADYHVRTFAPIIRALIQKGIPAVLLNLTENAALPVQRPLRAHEMALYADIPMCSIYSRTSPEQLLVTTALAYVFPVESGIARNMIQHLQCLRVPALTYYEGIHDDDNVHETYLERPLPYRISDHLFLPGEYYKSIYAKVPHTVTGLPNMRTLYREKCIFPSKPNVLINCNFSYGVLLENREDFLATAIAACEDTGLEYRITQHIADKADLSGLPVSRQTVYDDLRQCSVLISRFSTCILEALALGKPAIYHNPHGEKFPKFQTDPMGAFPITRNREDLAAALRKTIAEIQAGVDFREKGMDFLHWHTNMLASTPPEEAAADKIAEIVRDDAENYQKRLFSCAEAAPFGPLPQAAIAPASAYAATLQKEIERLRGQEVYFWGMGDIYMRNKTRFAHIRPRCILVDVEGNKLPDSVDGIPIRHPKDVLPSGNVLPIVVFVQNINAVYTTIREHYPAYTDMVFVMY